MKFVMILCLLSSAAPTFAEGENSLAAEITLRNDQGEVFCSLFKSENGFPMEEEKAVIHFSVKAVEKTARCEFPDVKPGEYAIAVFHDENGDGKLDRSGIGIPREGVGTSGKAVKRFGPPKYKDAKFKFEGGSEVVKIQLHYP